MKNGFRIAGLGVLMSAAAMLAAAPASARGPMGDMPGGIGGFAQRGGMFATTFAELDLNGDGQITEEDLTAAAQSHFADVDTDGNGKLDAAELATAMQARITERMQGRTMGPRGMDADTMSARMAERILDARDADNDGALSLAELEPEKGFGRVIDRFDTDDDNAVSQAEFDEAKADMSARFARQDDHGGRGHGGWGGKRR
jgi:Ca2+-binding EF-hand superfamily protein